MISSSPASSLSSSSLDTSRARSFRDVVVSSDLLVKRRAKVLGGLVKDGAISKSLSLSLWAKFLAWRMESDDIVKMRDSWESRESEAEQMYILMVLLSFTL